MATNKDNFDTTYRKVHGIYVVGKDADEDTYNIIHVDANGHLFTKMVGDAGTSNVAIACDSDGYLKIVNPTGAATSDKQDALLDELKLKADLTETQPTKIHADAGGETATALTCDFNGYLYIIPMGVAAGDLKNPISVDSSGRVNINTAVSLPLPSGASTSENQTNGSQRGSISGRNIGKTAQVSPMRALSTFDQVRLCGTPFHGTTKDPNFWSETGTGASGSVTQSGGQVVLTTTADSGSAAVYTTVRCSRYISGSSNKFRAVVRFPDLGTASNNNVREFGAATATDGFLFQLAANVLNIVVRKSGVADQVIAKAAWTGTYASAFTLDTNVHTFEIQWTNSSAWFFIDDNIVHTVSGSTSPSTATLSFPCVARNVNTGVGPAVSLNIRTMSILRMGQPISRPHWKYTNDALAATVLKYGPGTIHRLVNGNNKGTLALYDCVTTGALTGQICLLDLTQMVGNIDFELDFCTGLIMVQTDAASETTIIYE